MTVHQALGATKTQSTSVLQANMVSLLPSANQQRPMPVKTVRLATRALNRMTNSSVQLAGTAKEIPSMRGQITLETRMVRFAHPANIVQLGQLHQLPVIRASTVLIGELLQQRRDAMPDTIAREAQLNPRRRSAPPATTAYSTRTKRRNAPLAPLMRVSVLRSLPTAKNALKVSSAEMLVWLTLPFSLT